MGEAETRAAMLEAEGWTRQFLAGEPRLSEAVELYKQLGLEVHLEPVSSDSECKGCADNMGESECRACFEGYEDRYKIIYTRPARNRQGSDNDLF